MAASTSRAMSSIQCATTPSLHALHNTPMKLLFVRIALGQQVMVLLVAPDPGCRIAAQRSNLQSLGPRAFHDARHEMARGPGPAQHGRGFDVRNDQRCPLPRIAGKRDPTVNVEFESTLLRMIFD